MSPQHHIPQPPHSAGEAYKGLRARIDLAQLPSPILAVEADKHTWRDQTFMTLPGNNPPLSTTDFVALDQGNSSPRYMRTTTWTVPSSARLARECEIPLAVVVQPFVDPHPNDQPVPLVDLGADLPVPRCALCRAYVNPWCVWTAGGSRWRCNLCAHETQVDPAYFSSLDPTLVRLDHPHRPELNHGTVDFVLHSNEYWPQPPPPRISPLYVSVQNHLPSGAPRQPRPMRYLFALDVSADAVVSGLLQSACTALLDILYGGTTPDGTSFGPCFPHGCEVAILTFDTTLHFYNLSSTLPQVPAIVLADLTEIFVPLCDGLFVDPSQSRQAIDGLLRSLPDRHASFAMQEACLGGALIAGLASLAGRGGHLIAFQSTLPTIGPGALDPLTNESEVYSTEKETTLFLPRDRTWRDIAEECAEEGIGVSMFLGMSKTIDIGSIGIVASTTGGDIYFHPRFKPARDSIVLASQLRRLVTRPTVYNCVMRIRCSQGLRVSRYIGNMYQRTSTDVEMGVLDADKAFSAVLEHTRTLDEREYVYLQNAVLYTTRDGQRRLRTCNLALSVTILARDVFQFADVDAVVCQLARESMEKLKMQRMAQIREELTDQCASMLLGYRRNCAAATSATQLIIPEALKSLPVYTLAITKTKPLKGRNVSADVRNHYAYRILSMGVRSTMQNLYPRLLALHGLADDVAFPDDDVSPPLMRDSHLYMEACGVYLIDNEEFMIFWVGARVSKEVLWDLFGVEDVHGLDTSMPRLPVLTSRLSRRVHNILGQRYGQRGHAPRMLVVRQNLDGMEIEFSDMLVEDQNNGAMSYLDYLCLVHKQISTALTQGGSISGGWGLRGPPW